MKVCDHCQQAGLENPGLYVQSSFRVSWSPQAQVLQEPSTMAPESQAALVGVCHPAAGSGFKCFSIQRLPQVRQQAQPAQVSLALHLLTVWTPQSDNNYKYWANIHAFHKHSPSARSLTLTQHDATAQTSRLLCSVLLFRSPQSTVPTCLRLQNLKTWYTWKQTAPGFELPGWWLIWLVSQ